MSSSADLSFSFSCGREDARSGQRLRENDTSNATVYTEEAAGFAWNVAFK